MERQGFFDPDNKFFVGLGKVGDYMLLSLLWIATSLPIITIGASTTAMDYCSMKLLDGNEGYLMKDYFKSFKENFKQATILWIGCIALGLFFFFDLNFYYNRALDGASWAVVCLAVFAMFAFLFVMTVVYLYGYLARFNTKNLHAIKVASLLTVKHLGYTFLMAVGDAAVIVLAGFNQLGFLIPFVPGIIGFFHGLCLNLVLRRYLPKEEEEEEL